MVTNNQATQTEPETAELVNMFCPIHNVCEQEFVSRMGGAMVLNAPGANACCLPLRKLCTGNYTRNCRNKTGNSWRVSVIAQ